VLHHDVTGEVLDLGCIRQLEPDLAVEHTL
jgi:hypothetical protein